MTEPAAPPAAPRPTLLLDTAGLYFRAFHALPTSLRAPGGTPVNAVRGLLDSLARLVELRRPARVVACWDDDWRPAFRVAAVPAYKAHRVAPGGGEDVPDGLAAQVPLVAEVLAALGVPVVGSPGYEADDVIATLVRAADGPVEVATGDRDLLALVDDARGVRVLWTAGRGGAGPQVLDAAAVRARYGVGPSAYPDLALLRGDPSDGLPGVPGVGERTAARLLAAFGDVAGVVAAAEDPAAAVAPGLRARLLAARGYLSAAAVAVGLVADVPLPAVDGRLPLAGDPGRLDALAAAWALGGSPARARAALSAPG